MPTPRTPWGASLYGSEKAEVDLQLRGSNFNYATTPIHTRTYIDSRTCSDTELTRQIKDMMQHATTLYEEWKATPYLSKGEGGSCLYRPTALTLSNWGWAILSDTRTVKIKHFTT